VTIVACGSLVYQALLAADELAKDSIAAEVINSPSIKPLDVDTIVGSAQKTGRVVTAEEHQINVNSELRIAFREELERSLQSDDTVKAYEFYAPVIEGVQKIVEQKIRVFGSDGQATSSANPLLHI